MSFIGSFAQGDWKRGLISMLPAGGNIHDLATGRTTVGELSKQAAVEGSIALATWGVGSALGAAASGLAKAAQAGVAAGTKAGAVGAKIASGAAKALGKASSLISPGRAKVGGPTGAAAPVSGAAAPVPGASSGSLASKIGAQAPGNTKLGIPNEAMVGTPGTLPGNTIKYSIPQAAKQASSNILGRAGSALRGAANTAKNKVGKITGQDVIQGALSVASAVGAAKQASAANKVSEQSLLFQKQTYNEQKAEVESNKAKLKSDAWTDYQSASLFGESLYGSDSNSTLLTSYYTNGTGNAGNFSLIGSSINTSRQTDLT